MAEAPKQLVVGGDRPAVYQQRPDLYAVRNGEDADAVAVVPDSSTDRFHVYKRGAERDAAIPSSLPVYAAGHSGPLAIATGRVLVRLADGTDAKTYGERFRSAGFDIDRLLSYAPHAAWLRPHGGDVADALGSLDALARLPGVVHVEPQLLLHRAEK